MHRSTRNGFQHRPNLPSWEVVSEIDDNSNVHKEIVIQSINATHFSSIFTGHVPACNQIWILGDSLLKTSASCLTALKTAYINDPTKPRLYIHDNYDVITAFEDENSKDNFLRQVRNNLAHLMKIHYKLPEKIIIILNNTILDDTAFAVTQLAEMLKWLLAEIESAISTRRKQLPIRCLKKGEPSVHLLKMLPRASRCDNTNLFKSIRRKVNNQIPSITERFQFGFINVCEITTTSSIFFDRTGRMLTPSGIMQFWESISDTVKEMNDDKLPKPKTRETASESSTSEKQEKDGKDNRKNSHPDVHAHQQPRRSQPSNHYYRRRSFDYNTYDYNRFHYYANRKY